MMLTHFLNRRTRQQAIRLTKMSVAIPTDTPSSAMAVFNAFMGPYLEYSTASCAFPHPGAKRTTEQISFNLDSSTFIPTHQNPPVGKGATIWFFIWGILRDFFPAHLKFLSDLSWRWGWFRIVLFLCFLASVRHRGILWLLHWLE